MKSIQRRIIVIVAVACVAVELQSQGVSIIDTVYTPPQYTDGALTATIFIPDPSVSKRVGVILGRYTNATRMTAKVWCDTLAARGYLAMTIDYGNLDVSVYPKPQRAFKTAVEFLRAHADRFQISPNRIVGFGQSQGALIWGQTIPWDDDDAFFGTDAAIRDGLDAAVLLYGAYDMFNHLIPIQNTILSSHFAPDPSLRGTKGQCISNVERITTPVLLIHGTGDQVVDIAHSRKFADSLRVHGKAVKQVEMIGASHVFDLAQNGQLTQAGLAAKDSMIAFLVEVFTPSSAAPLETFVPIEVSLAQNYPNPFNPSTQISYSLPITHHASLKVFDLLGREVAVLVDEESSLGAHTATWDASGFPSGVYFYRLHAGDFVETKKLILTR